MVTNLQNIASMKLRHVAKSILHFKQVYTGVPCTYTSSKIYDKTSSPKRINYLQLNYFVTTSVQTLK